MLYVIQDELSGITDEYRDEDSNFPITMLFKPLSPNSDKMNQEEDGSYEKIPSWQKFEESGNFVVCLATTIGTKAFWVNAVQSILLALPASVWPTIYR